MGKAGLTLSVGLAVAIIVLVGCQLVTVSTTALLSGWSEEQTRHAREMNILDERERAVQVLRDAEQDAATAWARHLAWSAVYVAGGMMALVLSGLFAGKAMNAYRNGRDLVAYQGVSLGRQLAVEGATLPAYQTAVVLHGQAHIEKAKQPPPLLPGAKFTDARKVVYGGKAAPVALPELPQAPLLPPPPSQPIPTLAEAVRTRPQDGIIVGYDRERQPLTLGLDDIGATLVVGEGRTGKSSTVAAVTAQLAAMNAQFFVIDPHARLQDSLAMRLAPLGDRVALCVSTPEESEGVLRAVTDEYTRRLAGEGGDPVFLLVDELNTMTTGRWAGVGEAVAELTQQLAREGGKMGMGVMAIAHLATVQSLSSHLGYVARTVLAHRTVPTSITKWVEPDLARRVRDLGKGELLAVYPGGHRLVRVPRSEPDDVKAAVASFLPTCEAPAPALPMQELRAEPTPMPSLLTETELFLLRLGRDQHDGFFPINRMFQDLRESDRAMPQGDIEKAGRKLEAWGYLAKSGMGPKGPLPRRLTEKALGVI